MDEESEGSRLQKYAGSMHSSGYKREVSQDTTEILDELMN